MAARPKWWHMLQGSKREALLAVDLYNRAASERSLEGYVVHMHMAWLYMHHAKFLRDDVDFRYREPGGRRFREGGWPGEDLGVGAVPRSYRATPAILGQQRATQRSKAKPKRSAGASRVSPLLARGHTARADTPAPVTMTLRREEAENGLRGSSCAVEQSGHNAALTAGRPPSLQEVIRSD